MIPLVSLLFVILFPWSIGANPLPSSGQIVLVPIDDRPAVAQFAVMIGAIADYEVRIPSRDLLGRFTTPGNPEKIDAWLRRQDYRQVDAIIVSADMLIYGGLIASRSPKTSMEKAKERLAFFRWFKKEHPRIPIYAFSVLMRVAPTADAASRPWRDDLARWAELQDRVPKTGDPRLAAELAELKKRLAPSLLTDYMAARQRDLQIHLALLDLVKNGILDTLIFLQDDAREYGLHRQDQEVVGTRLKALGLETAVPIYNGADEGSLSLVSRAIIEKERHPLRIEVIYSSPQSREVIAPFEDHPLHYTVEHQILSSGAQPVTAGQEADYRLFLNAPKTSEAEFQTFSARLIAEIKAGKPTALADILFPPPHHSGADERLIGILQREGLFDKLIAYAGWNTAGNTLGTAIPQANMYRLFQSRLADTVERAARTQTAQLEFLLHRFAGDYLYHDVVRFQMNRKLREGKTDPTDEFTAETYQQINRQIQEQLKPKIEEFFTRYFMGKSYPLRTTGSQGSERWMKITGLRDLSVYLPWPRTFEVTINYKMDYSVDKTLRTPPPGPKPQINGPGVYGARPGRPFLYRIPCTGERPISFEAKDLPGGLTLDSTTGILRGQIPEKQGDYTVLLSARNKQGRSQRTFRIVVGNQLALTPPMGWNSWYTWYNHITDQLMRQAADSMIRSGMADFGYQYVNIDDCWSIKPGNKDPLIGGSPARSPQGSILANGRFPDMKALTDYIHSLGLKAGIYTSPGPTTCAGFTASYQNEEADARQFAAWGFDFLKYDWCSYGKTIPGEGRERAQRPYRLMGSILPKLNRDVLYNLCQYGDQEVWKWGKEVGGHCWRTTGDLGVERGDRLPGFYHIGRRNAAHFDYAGPGAWNDPDYILIGVVGNAHDMNQPPQKTNLTPEEQYSYMSMWALMAAPLFYSGDINRLDPLTLNVLCNAEVIEVNQDPLGRQARILRDNEKEMILLKPMDDGSYALGLFNLSESDQEISVTWSELGIKGKQISRDVWRQKDLGTYQDEFRSKVGRHDVALVRLRVKS